MLGRAIDLLDERRRGQAEPTVTDVLTVIEEGPDLLRSAARAGSPDRYHDRVADLVFTLDLLCTGSLGGVFDGPTSQPIDLDAPAVSVDLSAVRAAGDKLLTAAMLCTWSYGFGCVDAASRAGRPRVPGRAAPTWASWTNCGAPCAARPGLVEHADSLTRLNRARGMASIMITHSLADLDALATEEDRAKARGFMDRSAITVLAGLPPRELARVSEITPLTGPEQALVASWSAPGVLPARRPPPRPRQVPDQDRRAARHPGPAHPGRAGARAVRHRPGHPAQPGTGTCGEPGARAAAVGRSRRGRRRWAVLPSAGRWSRLPGCSGAQPGWPPWSRAAPSSRSARDSRMPSCTGAPRRRGRTPRRSRRGSHGAAAGRLRGCVSPSLAVRVTARLRPAPGDPVAALARNPRMRALTRQAGRRASDELRRSLARRRPARRWSRRRPGWRSGS